MLKFPEKCYGHGFPYLKLGRQAHCIFILLAVTNIIYFNSHLNSFHFDDTISIVENTRLKDRDYFFELFSGFYRIFSQRPVVQASFLLNYQVSRLHVFGYHLFNTGAHCFVVVMVFFLSRYLILFSTGSQMDGAVQRGRRSPREYGLPFFAALVFGIHPIFTESVVYLSSRSEVLLTLFFLLALYFLIRFLFSGQKTFSLIRTVLFTFIGMATKTNFAAFPLVVLCYLVFFHPAWIRNALEKYKTPIGIFLLGIAGLAIFLIKSQGEELFYLSEVEKQWTPWQYFFTELNVIVFYYLKKIAFPFELNIDPHFPVSNSFFSLSLFSFLLIAGAMLLAFKNRKKDLLASFGLWWIFLSISPTSSFVPLLDFVSEHRMYLQGFGFVLVVCGIIYKRKSLAPLVPVLLIFLSALTIQRNFAWKDSASIWSDAVKKSPGKARPYYNLAKYYQESGKNEEAIEYYQKASALTPNAAFPYTGIGNVYMKMGELDLAEKNFRKALEINPRQSDPVTKLAQVYFKKGDLDRAEKLLTVDYIKKDQVDAYYLLGQIYAMKNKSGAALQQFFKAIKVNPDFSEAYLGVGILYAKENKFEDAEKYFLKSIKTLKENPGACFNLGYLYFIQKRYPDALARYQEALSYDPEMDQARIYSGDVYLELKDYPEALKYYGAVKEDGPFHYEGVFKKGLCYLLRDGVSSAEEYYSALRIEKKEAAMLYFQIGKLFESNGLQHLALKYYQKSELE